MIFRIAKGPRLRWGLHHFLTVPASHKFSEVAGARSFLLAFLSATESHMAKLSIKRQGYLGWHLTPTILSASKRMSAFFSI